MIKCKNECMYGKFEGCCHSCPTKCEDKCEHDPKSCGDSIFDEESGLVAFQEQQLAVIQKIADVCTAKKQIEAQEKELKDQLKAAMEQYGIKAIDNDVLKITYIAETTATSVDTAKLKKLHPDIAEQCSKVSQKSAYIKVEVKGGEKNADA